MSNSIDELRDLEIELSLNKNPINREICTLLARSRQNTMQRPRPKNPTVIALHRHWKVWLAVIGGNLLYFAVLFPRLPAAARHESYRLDWGLLVDFWVCLAVYGLLASIFPDKRK